MSSKKPIKAAKRPVKAAPKKAPHKAAVAKKVARPTPKPLPKKAAKPAGGKTEDSKAGDDAPVARTRPDVTQKGIAIRRARQARGAGAGVRDAAAEWRHRYSDLGDDL